MWKAAPVVAFLQTVRTSASMVRAAPMACMGIVPMAMVLVGKAAMVMVCMEQAQMAYMASVPTRNTVCMAKAVVVQTALEAQGSMALGIMECRALAIMVCMEKATT